MITLKLKEKLSIPVEADCITPDNFQDKTNGQIKALTVHWGNKKRVLGDFFEVDGEKSSDIVVEGDCDKVKLIGHQMSFGSIHIKGNCGYNTGTYMTGGKIVIDGNARDYLGALMEGGQIFCNGDVGHFLGGAYKGETTGMSGGEIVVKGNAGHEIGGYLRRGLIAVGGDCGDFPGIFMQAGNVVILGKPGIRGGSNMVRGTIVLMNETEIMPTFYENSLLNSPAIDMLLNRVSELGLDVKPGHTFRRFTGDMNQIGKGEILMAVN